MSLLLFFLLSLFAEIVGTVGGFGSSLFFVPIAGYFFDFYSVLGITAIFHLASNITKIALFRNGIDKRLVFQVGIPAVLFVVLGAYLTQFYNKEDLEFSLSIFLIVISGILLLFKSAVIQPTLLNSILGGSLSGIIAGLLGTGGAIRGLVLSAFDLKIEVFIATSAIIDLGIDLSRSIVYFFNGYVHRDDLYLIPILIPVSFIGTFIGKKILARFSGKQFKFTVLILIMAVGLFGLIRQFHIFN